MNIDSQLMAHFNAMLEIMKHAGLSHAEMYMHLYGILNNWWFGSSMATHAITSNFLQGSISHILGAIF